MPRYITTGYVFPISPSPHLHTGTAPKDLVKSVFCRDLNPDSFLTCPEPWSYMTHLAKLHSPNPYTHYFGPSIWLLFIKRECKALLWKWPPNQRLLSNILFSVSLPVHLPYSFCFQQREVQSTQTKGTSYVSMFSHVSRDWRGLGHGGIISQPKREPSASLELQHERSHSVESLYKSLRTTFPAARHFLWRSPLVDPSLSSQSWEIKEKKIIINLAN